MKKLTKYSVILGIIFTGTTPISAMELGEPDYSEFDAENYEYTEIIIQVQKK